MISVVDPGSLQSLPHSRRNGAGRLDPQGRKDLALSALGRTQPISTLAEEHSVSRKFVYEQVGKANTALDRSRVAGTVPQLLCEPETLFCLGGARLTLVQATATVFLFGASIAMILLGCAPISWFFTISTETTAWRFITLMHLAVIGAATMFGVVVISRTARYFLWKRPDLTLFHQRVLKSWFVLFVVVAMQMAYYLRPLQSEGPFLTGERGLFTAALGKFFGLE